MNAPQDLLGPASQFYVSQRLRLHYLDWGNVDKPLLLLIHGGRDHAHNWDWVARELRSEYHIVAPAVDEEEERLVHVPPVEVVQPQPL